ncbi:MAG: ribose-5-phosphate isomerase RpiA [Gammaproteobacteria bacterium]
MNDKERVARQAAGLVKDGMLVGLGTGSTANYFIDALAQRSKEEGLNIRTVSSSVVSAIKAEQAGLPLVALELVDRLDVYVDGADEVAPDMTLLKGRGYDLVREKLLANAADTFWVLVDDSKLVDRIGARYPIPVEVMPFAWRMVKESLEALGGKAELRQNAAKDGLAITSYGSLVFDVAFDPEQDIKSINDALSAIPGVVEHGIFYGLAGAVFIGRGGQVEERRAPVAK